MRGFFKATALLSANLVSALVIPDPAVFQEPPTDSIVEYARSSESEAQLKFVLNNVEQAWSYPVLLFEVGTTERLCAESNLTLDGQELQSQWNGIQATGNGNLEAYGNTPMSWTITCLWDSGVPYPNLGAITHLLTLKLLDSHGRETVPAFTVSYKQSGQPSILHFAPVYTTPTGSNGDYSEWRERGSLFIEPIAPQTPPSPSTPQQSQAPESPESPLPPLVQADDEHQQISLAAKVKEIKGDLQRKIHSMLESIKKLPSKLCPERAGREQKALKAGKEAGTHSEFATDDEVQHDELDLVGQAPSSDGAPTSVQQYAAAQTRSLSEASSSSASASAINDHHSGIPSAVVLKSFFLSLVVLSLFSWMLIRCRDPRRRAERAAVAEERRTKRLYRRAARRWKLKTTIWNFRMKYGLVSAEAVREDEKSRRVSEQENVLESAVKDEIQALRDAHRAVSSITGASISDVEEGRPRYVYDDRLGVRRFRSTRSMSTLPEYESEGSRPPSYRSRRGSVTEFTSDSSVVSTSPRISRDGTNSDIEEKIEELNIYETRADSFQPRT